MDNIDLSKEDFDLELQDKFSTGKFLVGIMSKSWSTKLFNAALKLNTGQKRKGVKTEKMVIKSRSGGRDIPLVIYKPLHADEAIPIMLYIHGGGYITGSPEISPKIEDFIFTRPCIIVAPRYRRAMTAPYPAALDDCYDTLLWINESAHELGTTSDKVIVAGHSAGGGLTAAVSLKNRDRKDQEIAFQIPLYPMIDHRNNTDSSLMCTDTPVWNRKSNQLGWDLYLKDLIDKTENIPAYASPALSNDFSKLPPTITFVGGMEPFRDEVVSYVQSLEKANIPVKFKLFPKAFHAFESIAPDAKISKEATQFMLDSYTE